MRLLLRPIIFYKETKDFWTIFQFHECSVIEQLTHLKCLGITDAYSGPLLLKKKLHSYIGRLFRTCLHGGGGPQVSEATR